MPKSKNSLSDLLYDIRRISEHREKLSEKRIQAIYQTLSKDLDSFIADGYKKYADDDGRFHISYLDAQNQRAKFLQEIVDNIDNLSPKVEKEIMTLVDETYDKSYKGMLKAFKQADTTQEFETITKDIDVNPNILKRAVDNNISKLTLPSVLQKHRQEVIYQIQQELNIGLMQGDRYEKMTKRISERIGVSHNKAKNIARTETHRNVESGFMDCAEHIQDGLGGSDLIYAATWRTMKDERVRPNQRRKTKKGWVTRKSKNGANHQMMEGVTVKAGELFDLGGGVKAKAPSQSGVAAHDCNCRCFLEYNLMTVEEFAKATGKKVVDKSVAKSDESGIIRTEENLSELGKFKNKISADERMSKKYYTEVKEKFSHGKENAKKLFNKYVPDNSVADAEYIGTPCFKLDEKKIYMNYAADLKNDRGSCVTYFHEHGHLIDAMMGGVSKDERFLDILDSDRKNYVLSVGKANNLKTFPKVYKHISNELNDMRKHSAVSDILQGLTDGGIQGVAGHNTGYWINKDNITSEAFAHMFEAQFDEIRYKELEKVFPNALKYFEEKLKGVL